MADAANVLGVAGLVSGVAGGLVGAYTTLRKDRRDQDTAPITKQDAILTQSGEAMLRMVDRTRVADERVAALDDANDELRARVAQERARRVTLGCQLDACASTVRAWREFGSWLVARWDEARQSTDPPTLPTVDGIDHPHEPREP